MSDQKDPVEISTTEARGAVRTGRVWAVLLVSVALAVAAMALLGVISI